MAKSWVVAGTTAVLVSGCVGGVIFYGEEQQRIHKAAFTYETISSSVPIRRFLEKNGKLPTSLEDVGVKPHHQVNWDVSDTHK